MPDQVFFVKREFLGNGTLSSYCFLFLEILKPSARKLYGRCTWVCMTSGLEILFCGFVIAQF